MENIFQNRWCRVARISYCRWYLEIWDCNAFLLGQYLLQYWQFRPVDKCLASICFDKSLDLFDEWLQLLHIHTTSPVSSTSFVIIDCNNAETTFHQQLWHVFWFCYVHYYVKLFSIFYAKFIAIPNIIYREWLFVTGRHNFILFPAICLDSDTCLDTRVDHVAHNRSYNFSVGVK